MNGPLALVAAIWTTMISRKDFQQQPQRWPQNLWLQPRRSLKTASKLQRLLQFIPRDLRLECMVLGTIHILRKHIFRPFWTPPTVCWNGVLRGRFLGIKMQHWNKCLSSLLQDFVSFWSIPYQPRRGVYLCLIFEMSIWEFITNSKKIDFKTNSIFCRVRTWFLLPV